MVAKSLNQMPIVNDYQYHPLKNSIGAIVNKNEPNDLNRPLTSNKI